MQEREVMKEYYVIETVSTRYTVKANSREQAIEDMEYERDTVDTPYTKVIDREVFAEIKDY